MTDAEETTFTAKQLARKMNTDPKTLRKFLRSKDSPVEAVGQGGRYEFDAPSAKLIADAFKSWGGVKPTKLKTDTQDDSLEVLEEVEDEEPAPPKKPARKPRAKKGVEPEIVEDAVEELEELEPDAEELEEIEDLEDLFDELDD